MNGRHSAFPGYISNVEGKTNYDRNYPNSFLHEIDHQLKIQQYIGSDLEPHSQCNEE